MSRENEDEGIVSQRGEILFYQAEDGTTRLECRFEDETIWLSQAMLCDLYQKSKATISEHLKNIFQDDELREDSVVRFFPNNCRRWQRVQRKTL